MSLLSRIEYQSGFSELEKKIADYLTWTIYFLFIMIKNVDISILSADYILVDFAFWHTFDIFCFENIVYSI